MNHHSAAPSTRRAKKSYTIACASAFRDDVEALAQRRGVNPGDLARSIALMLDAETLRAYPDPGEPAADDRETIVLKSGKAKGRPWRRKPRIQVRMAPGYDVPTLRRALAVALDMDGGQTRVILDAPSRGLSARIAEPEEIDRLKAMVSALSFEPLPGGVEDRADALHVLGFRPGSRPDVKAARARFRVLATIHHPDYEHGSHERMSQLNSAMEILKRGED